MRVRVLLEITADDGTAGAPEEVASFEKKTDRPEDLGVSIAEGKALMAAVQQRTVKAQAAAWAQRHRRCPACGERRRIKGSHRTVFHTLYGEVDLDGPRLHRCPCQVGEGSATTIIARPGGLDGSAEPFCATVSARCASAAATLLALFSMTRRDGVRTPDTR